MIDIDAPPRKKPLDVAIRDGRARWQRLLKARVADAQRALDRKDYAAAGNYLRRARVCEAALRGWDDVEQQAAQGVVS